MGLTLLGSTFLKASDSTFTITGKFDKVKSGKIYLLVYYASTSFSDSTNLINGNFKFTGNIPDVANGLYHTKKWMEAGIQIILLFFLSLKM